MSKSAKIRKGIILVVIFFILGFVAAYAYDHVDTSDHYIAPLEQDTSQSKLYSTKILAVGDVMLGRNVELLMDTRGDEYPFVFIKDLFAESDTVLINLEGPVVTNHKRTPSGGMSFTFDKRMPAILKQYNVGIASLANNHTFDHGASGYTQTRTYLNEVGIDAIGHPFAVGDDYIVRKTINSQHYIFIGFNITNPGFDFQEAKDFVQNIERNPNEIVIATVHGGDEYQLTSNQSQKDFYRSLIDVGVDSVIAHHPHVVQEIEEYNNKIIFYSLGNFIFDQYFSKDVEQGLAVRIHADSYGSAKPTLSYELIPILSKRSQPEVMDQEQKLLFLKDLAKRSSPSLVSEIERGRID